MQWSTQARSARRCKYWQRDFSGFPQERLFSLTMTMWRFPNQSLYLLKRTSRSCCTALSFPLSEVFLMIFVQRALYFHGEHKGIGCRHSRGCQSENVRLSEKMYGCRHPVENLVSAYAKLTICHRRGDPLASCSFLGSDSAPTHPQLVLKPSTDFNFM